MKTSESIKEISAALVKAQAAIERVVKDKTGKIETKSGAKYEYKYSDLASVIDAVKGPLNEAGIAFIQCPSADSTGVTVTTTFLHTSGEWVESTIYLPVTMQTPQAFGSAITYGKRYGLQSMTGLPSEDDDGKKASEEPPPKLPMSTADFSRFKNAIGLASTEIELKKAYSAAYVAAQQMGDTDAVSRLTDLKDERKRQLHEGADVPQ